MKLTFEELGAGFYVEIRDPKRMSWKDKKAITSAYKDDSIVSSLDVAERIAIALITSGYLLDADNKQVTFPLTEQNIGDVPALVIEQVAKSFSEAQATPKN